MIDSLFEIFVLKSIGIAILLLLIIVVRPMVLKWLNAQVAYGLWLMLPIYLLMPVTTAEMNSTGGFMTFILGGDILSTDHNENQWFDSGRIVNWSLIVWGSGCLIMLGIFSVRYQRLKKSLKEIRVSNRFINKQSDAKNGINIQFVSSSLIDVPAVFGLFQSYLILPDDFFSLANKNQQMILQHEFYHLNRHDHRFNFLRVFIKSLFWFNPMFYWADKYCEADQEMSCDLGVLQNSDIEERRNYANVLLQSMIGIKQNKLISQWKYQSLIKERVKMLKNINSKKWHSWVAVVFAAGAIWGTSSVVMAEKEEVVDSGAIPISIIQPRYPRKAAEEGVEGWVKFGFDLDPNGSPFNIRVIAAQPKGVFEDASSEVIKKWKFKVTKAQKNLIYTMEFLLKAPETEEK